MRFQFRDADDDRILAAVLGDQPAPTPGRAGSDFGDGLAGQFGRRLERQPEYLVQDDGLAGELCRRAIDASISMALFRVAGPVGESAAAGPERGSRPPSARRAAAVNACRSNQCSGSSLLSRVPRWAHPRARARRTGVIRSLPPARVLPESSLSPDIECRRAGSDVGLHRSAEPASAPGVIRFPPATRSWRIRRGGVRSIGS